MYCIQAAKNNLNYRGRRSLYFALIHSHLSYCPSILGGLPNSNIRALFKIKKKAIRMLSKSKYNAHTAPLFLEHQILPLAKIIKQGRLVFMHSVYYGYAPKSFNNVWVKNSEREGSFHLRNDHLFVLPSPRLELFKRLTYYSLPITWNTSEPLMFYDNRFTFKHALRDQLFNEIALENEL